jgi:hypothetical protein
MANETVEEPTAATAGDQDHEDPDEFRGEEADAPRDPDAEIDDAAIDALETEEVEHGPDQTGSGS